MQSSTPNLPKCLNPFIAVQLKISDLLRSNSANLFDIFYIGDECDSQYNQYRSTLLSICEPITF